MSRGKITAAATTGGVALRDSLPYPAPIYLEADVTAARRFIRLSPDLRNLLSEVAMRRPGVDPGAVERTVGAFLIFCGLSGAVYLLNDLRALERDRLHPAKRQRGYVWKGAP